MYTRLKLQNSVIWVHRRNSRSECGFRKVQFIQVTLFMVCAFLSNGINAQSCDTPSKHYAGSVVLRTEEKMESPGLKITGCIELMSEQEMFVAPKLLDSLGKSQRYFGRQAWAYCYVHGKDTVFYLNAGRNIRTFRWAYLKRMVTGPMELYFITLRGTSVSTWSRSEYTYYYLRKDGNWLNKKAIVWNEGGKRKQMERIFDDCAPALELIDKTTNLELDEILPQLVNLYNSSCSFKK